MMITTQHKYLVSRLLAGAVLLLVLIFGVKKSFALNGDTHLDAVFANSGQTDYACLGDGAGGFTCSDVSTDTNSTFGVALGDVDGDTHLDAIFANFGQTDRVCLGDGAGGFTCSDVSTDTNESTDVALGDVNGDAYLDAVFADSSKPNHICLGDGSGGFTCSDVSSVKRNSRDIALGDVDGDTHLDVVFANAGQSDSICLGDGAGAFTCSDIIMGATNGWGVALGDVDGDTHLDAIFANNSLRNRVCLGNGSGGFTCSDVSPDIIGTTAVELGDIDGDTYLDAVFSNDISNRVCLGDGSGGFTCSNVSSDTNNTQGVALGDVNGDTHLDAVFANAYQRNRVCLGNGSGGFTCSDVSSDTKYSRDVALSGLAGISANQPPIVTAANSSLTVNEGNSASNNGTVSDPDGDTASLSASVGSITNNYDGTWSWSFDTSDGPADSQTVTIDADDNNGGTAQISFELIVNNVAPTVDTITVPTDPIDINDQPVTGVSATFSDPAGVNDESYSCTVDYGDGNGTQVGSVTGTVCNALNQTYVTPGVYAVTVTVTDKDNANGSNTATEFIVIYDPEGGFVTGGGWIDSSLGAYIPDPSLTGKATFGFVSKYKKGANVPTGNTEFQFKVADLNFKSTSYEWLVVTGSDYAKFKGVGTINSEGEYKFQIWAGDNNPDTFRIKIWYDVGENEIVIYDNGMDQEIEGGSIVVHKAK